MKALVACMIIDGIPNVPPLFDDESGVLSLAYIDGNGVQCGFISAVLNVEVPAGLDIIYLIQGLEDIFTWLEDSEDHYVIAYVAEEE